MKRPTRSHAPQRQVASRRPELARVVIEEFLIAPVDYDRDALARDIAQHQAEKQRGEVGLTPEEARAWLRNARSA
jgi:hypothetical protein